MRWTAVPPPPSLFGRPRGRHVDEMRRASISSSWIWKGIARPNSGLSFCVAMNSRPSAEAVEGDGVSGCLAGGCHVDTEMFVVEVFELGGREQVSDIAPLRGIGFVCCRDSGASGVIVVTAKNNVLND